MDRQLAVEIAGPLSNPSKMPCKSWGISTDHCKVGCSLRKIEGSICSTCYACKGRYVMPNVQQAQDKRYQGLYDPRWVEAIQKLIDDDTSSGSAFFRWFDSGDLQNMKHLHAIIEVAERLPHIQFWLPTQEKKLIRKNTRPIPDNLVIRVSSVMIEDDPPHGFPNTSGVAGKWRKASWSGADHECPAPLQGGRCNNCRKCWDRSVPHVTYLEH